MIWISIFSLLFILMLILSKACFGAIKNPISIFCLLWCFIGIGANCSFYDYYKPSTFVNFIILMTCILSFLIYAILLKGYNKFFFINNLNIEDGFVNIKRVVTINLIFMILLIPYIIQSINILINGGFSLLRAQDIIDNGLLAVVNDSIIRPTFVATTILAIVYSCTKAKKKDKLLLITVSIVTNIEQVILTAGRSYFVNFIFYLIITIILFYGKNILSLLYHGRRFIILAIIGIVIVLKITAQRSMSTTENMFLYNAYVYYFSGPSYLTQLLKYINSYGINGKLLYGAASFGFLSNIISNILIYLTGKPQGSLYLLGSVISNNQYSVGSHTLINAMYTCFYPFLIDYGWLGIIICPIFIGVGSAIITKRLYRNRNVFNTSLYIYWIYVLIRTVFKWDLVNIDLTVVIIVLMYFTKHSLKNYDCIEY